MKSGESHCNHEPASDVQRGDRLSSASLTASDVWQGGKRRKKEKKDILIKSNNPHLAGGEKDHEGKLHENSRSLTTVCSFSVFLGI